MLTSQLPAPIEDDLSEDSEDSDEDGERELGDRADGGEDRASQAGDTETSHARTAGAVRATLRSAAAKKKGQKRRQVVVRFEDEAAGEGGDRGKPQPRSDGAGRGSAGKKVKRARKRK